MKFTACYTSITGGGYMGKLLEWPEVSGEGATVGECRASLIDAARRVSFSYRESGRSYPRPDIRVEPLWINVN